MDLFSFDPTLAKKAAESEKAGEKAFAESCKQITNKQTEELKNVTKEQTRELNKNIHDGDKATRQHITAVSKKQDNQHEEQTIQANTNHKEAMKETQKNHDESKNQTEKNHNETMNKFDDLATKEVVVHLATQVEILTNTLNKDRRDRQALNRDDIEPTKMLFEDDDDKNNNNNNNNNSNDAPKAVVVSADDSCSVLTQPTTDEGHSSNLSFAMSEEKTSQGNDASQLRKENDDPNEASTSTSSLRTNNTRPQRPSTSISLSSKTGSYRSSHRGENGSILLASKAPERSVPKEANVRPSERRASMKHRDERVKARAALKQKRLDNSLSERSNPTSTRRAARSSAVKKG